HETPHPRDALLEDLALIRSPAVGSLEARVQFGPNAFVRPLMDVFIGRALQIEPGDFMGAHAEERETTFMMAVNQFIRRGRGVRKNSKPRKWVDLFIDAKI